MPISVKLIRTLDTLQEYVLVSQDEINVELFRRNDAGCWELYVFKAGEDLEFASIEFDLPISAVYEDVIFNTI